MKKFFGEFKEFISRGNVMDLAVGMIIGAAFTAIVNSVVNDIVMPLISMITGGLDFTKWNIALAAGEEPPMLALGNFVSAVINFVIIAIIIFLIVKSMNKMQKMVAKKEEEKPAAPTTKVCPFCKSEIAIDATRCPHCTSELK
ncbi:MAG: large conductance mechanosensitive channel protein MscL [Lachnospiraceae bacterium]|nr:large conductance mechanosensitive channel protein MscL [Lachnospiraceae bacterium]